MTTILSTQLPKLVHTFNELYLYARQHAYEHKETELYEVYRAWDGDTHITVNVMDHRINVVTDKSGYVKYYIKDLRKGLVRFETNPA